MKNWISIICLLGGFLLGFRGLGYAESSSTLTGYVKELGTGQAMAGVTVQLYNADTLMGTLTDAEGFFSIPEIPFGRYNVEFSYVGFVSYRISELLLSGRAGRELLIELEEQPVQADTVQIYADQRWDPRNEAALVSGRTFTGEELSRIAGGLDDPARVAARFPGVVASPDVISNNINVRGNSSRAVLWRLEGIDIYNPNHFGQLEGSSGIVTIFSQQLLAQTDFFSAAFPADYGNALGSVFDVRFRNGNREKLHGTFQVGFLGLDASLEGPLGKSKRTTFLANYRYSTTGIADQFLQIGAIPVFQDFSLKVHHQLKNGGEVNVFGIGGNSVLTNLAERDTSRWDSVVGANVERNSNALTGTAGFNLTLPLLERTYVKLVAVGTGISFNNYLYEFDRNFVPDTLRKGETRTHRLSAHAFLNHKFSPRHTHRTGVLVHRLHARQCLKNACRE